MNTKTNEILNSGWGKHYGKPITETEYKEICTNLNNFFYLIKSWGSNTKKGLNNG